MSLMDNAMEDVKFLEKNRQPDGEGGFITVWSEGSPFKAAITFNSSITARIAQKQGVTSLYTVTTKKAVKLEYHDVFQRMSDGKIFRVTSDGDDVASPSASMLDMRQVTAEEWKPT